VERLFFRRRPSFRNKCQICGRLSLTPASALNFTWISDNVRSG
jgi:hypothetical protein